MVALRCIYPPGLNGCNDERVPMCCQVVVEWNGGAVLGALAVVGRRVIIIVTVSQGPLRWSSGRPGADGCNAEGVLNPKELAVQSCDLHGR